MPLLNELLSGIQVLDHWGDIHIPVNDLVIHADKVKRGDLYIALPGARFDGHDYIDRAIANGAAAVLLQEPERRNPGIVTLQVRDTRLALSELAAAWYGYPTREITMTGVTGTNGKTTVCYLLRAMLQAGYRTGLLGTIEYKAGEELLGSGLTTPAPLDLHRLLRQMRDRQVEQCVMEVTSHALVQHRVAGIDFKYAVFTNLTSEHLDYHGTMDQYLAAKLRLFHGLNDNATAIINLDDKYAHAVMEAAKSAMVLTYGINSPRASIAAESLVANKRGTSMDVNTPIGRFPLQSGLHGRHNASNILAAVAYGVATGMSLDAIAERIASFRAVPGRFEPVECGQPFPVIVDFCHTPDALTNTLYTIQDVYEKSLITVFGCGGDRDQEKRPQMGRIASTHSKRVIITNDNPRTEDPKQIIGQIERGLTSGCKVHIIPDRREAIRTALSLAGPGDAVLIAGKGHETWQEINGVRYPFDDRQVVREYFGG